MADISRKAWDKYIEVLRRLNDAAADQFKEYLRTHEIETRIQRDAAIEYAYALATKYGEASAEFAAQMYESVARASKKTIEAAIPAETATYGEVAKTINGTLKQSTNIDLIGNSIGRLVKQAGVDTVCKNAIRDGAEWAWIPSGDTCAFCMMLASNGWQRASKKTLKGNHAEHIHANCDCTFAVRFNSRTNVEGYDPDYYKKIFNEADGNSWQEKIDSLRREQYAEHKEKILRQQKEAVKAKNQVNEWASEKLQKSLGKNYDEFQGIVNNSDNKDLYVKYSEEFNHVIDSKRGYYDVSGKDVHYNLEDKEGLSKYHTLAHEDGHAFDYMMGRVNGLSYSEIDLINQRCVMGSGIIKTINERASNSDEFLAALRKDIATLKPQVVNKSIKEELLTTKAKRNATNGIQDMLDGAFSTRDNGILPWGHGNRYYDRFYSGKIASFGNDKKLKALYNEIGLDASNQAKTKRISRIYETASEAWANVASAVTCGGDTLTYVKKYMPETYKTYLEIIRR